MLLNVLNECAQMHTVTPSLSFRFFLSQTSTEVKHKRYYIDAQQGMWNTRARAMCVWMPGRCEMRGRMLRECVSESISVAVMAKDINNVQHYRSCIWAILFFLREVRAQCQLFRAVRGSVSWTFPSYKADVWQQEILEALLWHRSSTIVSDKIIKLRARKDFFD